MHSRKMEFLSWSILCSKTWEEDRPLIVAEPAERMLQCSTLLIFGDNPALKLDIYEIHFEHAKFQVLNI